MFEKPIVAQRHKRVTINAMWVRFPLEEMNHLIFSFLRSCFETEHDVEFSRYTMPPEFAGK